VGRFVRALLILPSFQVEWRRARVRPSFAFFPSPSFTVAAESSSLHVSVSLRYRFRLAELNRIEFLAEFVRANAPGDRRLPSGARLWQFSTGRAQIRRRHNDCSGFGSTVPLDASVDVTDARFAEVMGIV
jgi:hypothetical protein